MYSKLIIILTLAEPNLPLTTICIYLYIYTYRHPVINYY